MRQGTLRYKDCVRETHHQTLGARDVAPPSPGFVLYLNVANEHAVQFALCRNNTYLRVLVCTLSASELSNDFPFRDSHIHLGRRGGIAGVETAIYVHAVEQMP